MSRLVLKPIQNEENEQDVFIDTKTRQTNLDVDIENKIIDNLTINNLST